MKNPTSPFKTPILFLLTLLCAAVASVQSVHAAPITVTSTADSGANTLRQALADAVDGDTIDFSVTGTITLTSADLVVDDSITISGPGVNTLAVVGNGTSIMFYINSGKTVTISGLTITNGVGSDGGGIYNDHSTLDVNNSSVSANGSAGVGGGIYNDHGVLRVTNSTIRDNVAVSGGGGIYNDHGTVRVTNSTVSTNSAGLTGNGGGIYNDGSNAPSGSARLVVINSTFSHNGASAGSGIANVGELSVTNSTFSGFGFAGTITNFGTVTMENTILSSGGGANIINDSGTVSSLGYNLSDDDGGGYLIGTGDQINTVPVLGPLKNNGGSTFTHELLTGSPAIDKGRNFTAATTDQRGPGFDRTVDDPSIANATGGDGTDIGAFEVQASAYAAQIQQPINADGTSVFNVRRGVVPVKFTLTLDGVATCDLPPATITLTRTAGGTIGPIDESLYGGPADTGSNFRIDSCQYIYNLSASALGAGTYRIDILIDGQVVGSAAFGLR